MGSRQETVLAWLGTAAVVEIDVAELRLSLKESHQDLPKDRMWVWKKEKRQGRQEQWEAPS